MTKMSLSKANKAHELREELISIKLVATDNFFRTGEILKEIRDGGLWKVGWHSFESWYADPDLGMKTSTVYHSIKLVETFPDWKGLIKIPISKLIMIAPHITEGNQKELISKAEGLSRGDLRHELVGHGLEPEVGGSNPLPKVYECRECKGLKGVNWGSLCHCGWTKEQIAFVGKLIDKVDFGGDI